MKKSDATLVELKKVTIFAIPSKRDAGLVFLARENAAAEEGSVEAFGLVR